MCHQSFLLGIPQMLSIQKRFKPKAILSRILLELHPTTQFTFISYFELRNLVLLGTDQSLYPSIFLKKRRKGRGKKKGKYNVGSQRYKKGNHISTLIAFF